MSLITMLSEPMAKHFIIMAQRYDAIDKDTGSNISEAFGQMLMPLYTNGTANDETVKPLLIKFAEEHGYAMLDELKETPCGERK